MLPPYSLPLMVQAMMLVGSMVVAISKKLSPSECLPSRLHIMPYIRSLLGGREEGEGGGGGRRGGRRGREEGEGGGGGRRGREEGEGGGGGYQCP